MLVGSELGMPACSARISCPKPEREAGSQNRNDSLATMSHHLLVCAFGLGSSELQLLGPRRSLEADAVFSQISEAAKQLVLQLLNLDQAELRVY